MTGQTLSGQCLCGRVTYTASNPISSLVCHCKDCQRQSGSSFSTLTLFASDEVRYTGDLSTYASEGDSGMAVERLFCPNCGSAIVSRCDILPGVEIIKAGTLDDTSGVQPAAQLYCDRQQAWVELPIENRFPLQLPAELLPAH